MQLSPTTVATVILESDTPTVQLDNLAKLMGLNPHKLPDLHVVQIIYAELNKELSRLQRKKDQLLSLLNNAEPLADLEAKALVGDAIEHIRRQSAIVTNTLNKWMERFPRCIPEPPMTLARAKALLSCQPK